MEISILYVEDEEAIRKNTSRPLKYLSDRLFVASDGLEGLELFKKYRPNIVISDIKMPKKNGIEMAKEIKKINPNQHIIFITAHNEDEYFLESIEMQVDGYILKPIDYDLLKNKINNIKDNIYLKYEYEVQKEQLHKQELYLLEQAKNNQMNELLLNIAHQWRQPLSVISTIATSVILKKELNLLDNDYVESSCSQISKTTKHLSNLIDIFSNSVNDKSDKIYNLKKLFDKTFDVIDTTMPNINVQINCDKSIFISISFSNFYQVFINLLKNSLEAFKKNSIKGFIKIDVSKDNKFVKICYEDNGGGIDNNLIDMVFDPYTTTKHKAQDVGLGLYIVKKIITSYDGKIEAFNSEQGAVFKILLPIYNS